MSKVDVVATLFAIAVARVMPKYVSVLMVIVASIAYALS